MGRERNSNTLNPEIKKIRLGELDSFCKSEFYRQIATLPITPSRAASYICNPNGSTEDVVLLLALLDGRLIAFRSLFAGVIQAEGEEVRFGWCSGNWVDPGFRRHGLSQLLLKEALHDWQGRLMFTNYAPESESLYLKTGLFKPIHQFEGIRGYLFPRTAMLFPNLKRNAVAKMLFPLIDLFAATVSRVKIFFYSYSKPDGIRFDLKEQFDEESLQFIEDYHHNYLFKRGANEINWILDYPWISEKNRGSEQKYPFSACSESFYYRTVKLMQNDMLKGVCLFSVREGHLKTLYLWLPSHFESHLAGYLKDYAIKQRLERLTIYHQGIANQLALKKFPFLHVKRIGQKVYSSFDAGNHRKYIIQDGDGDRAFT